MGYFHSRTARQRVTVEGQQPRLPKRIDHFRNHGILITVPYPLPLIPYQPLNLRQQYPPASILHSFAQGDQSQEKLAGSVFCLLFQIVIDLIGTPA